RRIPAVHDRSRIGIHLVRYRIREQCQLESPALHMLVAHAGFGEIVLQPQPRPLNIRFQPDRNPRRSWWNWLTAREPVGKNNPRWLGNLHHLANRFNPAALMPDINLPSGARINRGTRTPPTRPARAVGKKPEYSLRLRFDHNRPVELIRQFLHNPSVLLF